MLAVLSLDFLNRCQIRGCLHPHGVVFAPHLGGGGAEKEKFSLRELIRPTFILHPPPTLQILEISLPPSWRKGGLHNERRCVMRYINLRLTHLLTCCPSPRIATPAVHSSGLERRPFVPQHRCSHAFLPRMRCISAAYVVMRCPSVRLSRS